MQYAYSPIVVAYSCTLADRPQFSHLLACIVFIIVTILFIVC